MNNIEADSRTIRQLLSGAKYSIDYYQREYKWETKNIEELLDDLEASFFENYREGDDRTKVEKYGRYFLGSVVMNNESGKKYIIDGQQRLTSLTLLLIYLHNFQKDRSDKVDVQNLIFSEKFGRKSFNFDVEERARAMETLYGGEEYDASDPDEAESVRNIVARYQDIVDHFPDTLKSEALPYFVDWLLENVSLVEITAYSDDTAYTIFETMNDRGLSLSPTDMLKGYLLANIDDGRAKAAANQTWKNRMLDFSEYGKEEAADFFKAWLRGKHGDTIRERKKGATNKDFERIGTSFHRWIRDEKKRVGLDRSDDFVDFVQNRFARFSQHYLRIRAASVKLTPGLESVFYNAYNGFTLQGPLVLAPVLQEDDQETADRKIRLVSGFLDTFIARRVWNFRTLGYSSIVYTMFNLMRDIRDRSVEDLVTTLKEKIDEISEPFSAQPRFRLHQQNGHYVRYILARITSHVEEESGMPSHFHNYVSRDIKKPFEIEHIWADKYSRHRDEFSSEQEFSEHRNRIGGLLLIPRGFNQSYGDLPYEKKVELYNSQNLLARSLNERCYQNNPSFLSYKHASGLPFKPHAEFRKADLDARQDLYRQIAEEIWSPSRFDMELQ